MRRLFSVPLGTYVPGGIMFKRWDPSGVIAAGINLAGNFATNQINAERASSDMATYLNLVGKQRDWQKEDQRWSEDLTKRLMDYQNQYNTPAQQMKRYAGAGLNPYLALQGGELGSGNSQSVPSVSDPSRGSVSPFLRPSLENPVSDASSRILQGSQVNSQRMAALSSLFESAPKLFQAVGKERFNSIMSSILGDSVDSSVLQRISDSQALSSEYQAALQGVESQLAVKYGDKKASNFVALQEQQFNKMASEIGLMASEGKLNDAKIEEAVSAYCRNMADSYKLRMEGEKYVVEGGYYSALAELTSHDAVRAKFQNLSLGFYNGSPLRNLFMSKKYNKDNIDAHSLMMDRAASKVEYFLNKWLGEYLKVSSNVTPK